MDDFTFSLATPSDDADLRRLLATNPLPGRITVTFEREPNYFWGCGTMGIFWQVIVARHVPSGDLAAVLCRAARPHFINGEVQWLGYFGQLRVADRYRGLWILARGLPFMRTLHADGTIGPYLAAITDESRVARGVLVDKPRPSFPRMRPAARIHTLGLILQRPKPLLPSPYTLRRGSLAQLRTVVAFLRQQGAAKQFFPAYSEADFLGPTTRGFDLHDLIIACRGEEIVGVLGLWDQEGYKQTRLQSYHDYLRWLRPWYNAGARLFGAQPLPRPGEFLRSAYASFICVADNDPAIFRPLLRAVYNLAAERRYAHLILGLTEYDPLLQVAREYPHIAYYSRAYTVAWEDALDFHDRLDGRVPYIEIASL